MKSSEKDKFTINIIKGLLWSTLLIVLLLTYANGISGNDFWWHVKVGEWICENKEIPTTDIFSWYGIEQGFSWTAHEWLSEIILYKIFVLFGERGIFIFSVLMAIGLVVAITAQVEKYIEKNVYVTFIFSVLFVIITRLFFYGRPHIFSFYLLFFELKILYGFYENPKTKSIYWIPLIGCFWSNLHGGSSSMVYLLLFIFLFVSICEVDYGKLYAKRLAKREIFVLASVTLLTIFSLMLNPIGIRILIYPYVNIGDGLMQTVISEWASPDAKLVSNLILYYFPIAIMSFGIICTNKKLRLIDLLLMIFFLLLFFRSIRFIMLWYIAAAFYAFPYVSKYKIKKVKKNWEKKLAIIAMVLLIIPIGISLKKVIDVSSKKTCISTAMSDEAVTAVVNDAPQKVFNDYNLGETLIYHDIKVFFDARADVYSQANVLKDGMELMLLTKAKDDDDSMAVDVDAFIEKYGFDAILIQKNRPLYVYIKSHLEKFEYVYENQEVAYYRRKQ